MERSSPSPRIIGLFRDAPHQRPCAAGENSVSVFSLDEQTDISAKIYPYHKLLIVADGRLEVYRSGGNARTLGNGEALLTETDIPVGMRTDTGAVYTEIEIRRTDVTNGTQKR